MGRRRSFWAVHLSKACAFSSFKVDVKKKPNKNLWVLPLSAFQDPFIFYIKNIALVFHGEPSVHSCNLAEGKVSDLQLLRAPSFNEMKHRADSGKSKWCCCGRLVPIHMGGIPHEVWMCPPRHAVLWPSLEQAVPSLLVVYILILDIKFPDLQGVHTVLHHQHIVLESSSHLASLLDSEILEG